MIPNNKPGPAQVGAISKAQVFSFTVLENQKLFEKKFFEKITYSKKWTEWRAGAR